MKTMSSVPSASFYHSMPSLADTWYSEPRRTVRKKLYQTQPAVLEQHKYKQEVVCAVILALCLLFTVADCFAQLAVS